MTRENFLRMRDKAAEEIAKMYAAAEKDVFQLRKTLLRMQTFLGFHTLACNHLRSLHDEQLDSRLCDQIAHGLSFLRTLALDEDEEHIAGEVMVLLDRLLRIHGGGA